MTEAHGKGRTTGGGRAEHGTSPDGEHAEHTPSVVIRDKRKIRHGETGRHADTSERAHDRTDDEPTTTEDEAAAAPATEAGTVEPDASTAEEPARGEDATREATPREGTPREDEPATAGGKTEEQTESAGPLGVELEALRGDVDELTRDLQRITAEYANYRKRVDRDRALVLEQATSGVLTALLPVLDDLDRAREHGDLVGPFGSVAEQLIATLTKFGLTPFGEKGDPFDPTRHEAVAHQTSSEVTEPTCVDVLRRGYLLGERLLRPALVAVADPE